MAPYFQHLFQSIFTFQYFKALQEIAVEQFSDLKSQILQSAVNSATQNETFLTETNHTFSLSAASVNSGSITSILPSCWSWTKFQGSQVIPILRLLFQSIRQHDWRNAKLQFLQILMLFKIELLISLLFGYIVLYSFWIATERHYSLIRAKNNKDASLEASTSSKLNEEHVEEKDETEATTAVVLSSPIDAHISAITTPYKADSLAFLRSGHHSSNPRKIISPPTEPTIVPATPPVHTINQPPKSNVSPLTPDTGFNELLRKIEDNQEDNEIDADEEDDDEDDDQYSQGYSINTATSKSFSETKSLSTHPNSNENLNGSNNRIAVQLNDHGPSRNLMHVQVLQLSVDNPAILIGWKIFVPAYGHGVILSMKRRKFQTTRFNIQFENYTNIIELPLQRSKQKGKVSFTLIGKMK